MNFTDRLEHIRSQNRAPAFEGSRQEMDLGRSYTAPQHASQDNSANVAQAPKMSLADALAVVGEAFKRDPRALTPAILKALGGWEAIETMKPRKILGAMPTTDVIAVEVSIADNAEKAKTGRARVRKDQERLRYSASIQVWQAGAKVFQDKSWYGLADLRDPARARSDVAKRLTNPKKCKTPFSSEFADWLNSQIIPAAEENDMLIGFLFSTEKGAGHFYHEGQALLVPRDVVERKAPDTAAVLVTYGATIALPDFVTSDFKNAPLGGTFEWQSRGCTSFPFSPFRDFAKWATGKLHV